jgi:MtN3 and saliva related transmembrane protein
MELVTAIGFTAGALTTVAFWPQLHRTWKTRSAGDVSLGMLAIFTTGVLLWLIYGALLQSWPIIVTNAVTFLLTAAILILKLRFKP